MLRELTSPNGVGLSPDGRHVYYAETFPGRLWDLPLTARAWRRSPAASRPANFVGAYPGLGYFDSLGVQEDGGICVATILAGGISTFWPDTSAADLRPHAAARPDLHQHLLGRQRHENGLHHLVVDRKLAKCRWRSPGLRLAYNA